MIKLLLFLVLVVFGYIIIGKFFERGGNSFDMYVGIPGSGKTTLAAYLTKKRLKKAKKHKCSDLVLCNVPIKGTYKVVKSDIGHYEIKDCLLIMDEAGIDYNNRNFKSFSNEEVYFYKFHRHYNVDVAMFSQDFDVDLKLRKLCNTLYIVTKSVFPFFIKRKRVEKFIGIDDTTKQLVDQYRFSLFGTKLVFAPKLWKMFNTLDRKELPKKKFKKY